MICWSKSLLVFWTRNSFLQYLFYVLKSIWIDFFKWIFLQITQIKPLSDNFCYLSKLSEYVIFIRKYIFFLLDKLDFFYLIFHDYVTILNVFTRCNRLILHSVINSLMYIILNLLHSLWKIFLFLLKKSVQFVVHAYKACLTCKLSEIFLYFKTILFLLESIFCCNDECL